MDELNRELLALIKDLRAELADLRAELAAERAKTEKATTSGAERQRRYRERNALRNGDVTCDAQCDAPLSPPNGPPASSPCTPTSTPPLNPPLNPAHVRAHVGDDEIPFVEGSPAIDPSLVDDADLDGFVTSTGTRPAPVRQDRYTADFEAWWKLYPRKVSKDEAFKAWKRLIKAGYAPEEITAGLKRWLTSADWRGAEMKHIPHPTTWLNQKRFNDHPPAASGPSSAPVLTVMPDLPPADPLSWLTPGPATDELLAKPWWPKLQPHIGSYERMDVALMNFAAELGLRDVSRAKTALERDGLRAAGDWVWQNRSAM